jgi:hypothetical protein
VRADHDRFSLFISLTYNHIGCSYRALEYSTAISVLGYLKELAMVTQRSMKSQVAVADRHIQMLPTAEMVAAQRTGYDCLAIS